MVTRYTLDEANRHFKLSTEINILEAAIREKSNYKNAQAILNSNLLFNETSLETIASILAKDINKRVKELKEEAKGLGKEYKT